MKTSTKLLSVILAVSTLAVSGMAVKTTLMPSEAQAQSRGAKHIVDRAKAEGKIGERADGYLAVVDGSASQDVVNAMNEINIGRKSVYTRLARQQNVSIEVVGALAAEKQLGKARKGERVKTKDGRWVVVK